MQGTENSYNIPEQSNGKDHEVPLAFSTNENAALEDTTTSLDVRLPVIPLHITMGKPQQGEFPIPESDENFSDEIHALSLIYLFR